MSRVGKQPIEVPAGVEVSIEPRQVTVKGPKGTLAFVMPHGIEVKKEESSLVVTTTQKTLSTKKLWGTVRSIIANNIDGVTKGFEKKLEVEGVGFRVTLQGKDLEMTLGFSHPVKFPAPEGVEFVVEKNTITITGPSKDAVGRAAAEIRSLKKPEPYKGKGIHYVGEIIKRKAGKKAMGSA
ncbi:MAG: 50S ribosomal protein L6 [bacterium]|nr:50S ribosomal protein L6 [bacterium]